MSLITLILPYYHNMGMLEKQCEVINSYPESVRANLELIVVDDCSAFNARAEKAIQDIGLKFNIASFKLYRILTDLRWNWLQCRNLGAKEADSDFLLLTDIDHLVLPATMAWLMSNANENYFKSNRFYTFDRVDYENNKPYDKLKRYKPHPNSYFMSKKLYWAIGGYDETFSGNYGTDGMYKRRCLEHASETILAGLHIARVPREVIPDASTLPTMLQRKEGRAPGILEEIAAYKEINNIGIQTLRLPWMRVV